MFQTTKLTRISLKLDYESTMVLSSQYVFHSLPQVIKLVFSLSTSWL